MAPNTKNDSPIGSGIDDQSLTGAPRLLMLSTIRLTYLKQIRLSSGGTIPASRTQRRSGPDAFAIHRPVSQDQQATATSSGRKSKRHQPWNTRLKNRMVEFLRKAGTHA